MKIQNKIIQIKLEITITKNMKVKIFKKILKKFKI